MDKKRFKDRYYLVWLLTVTLGQLMSNVHLVPDEDIQAVIFQVRNALSSVELERERIKRNKEAIY